MPRSIAAVLVFFSSAAVLVLEILAARLLAPYVGVTLEAYTAIIGTILAGIAVGSWLGGRAADRMDPRAMIGPLLAVGGALAFVTVPLVDGMGAGLRGASAMTTMLITFVAFFTPAAVLTAVTPAVIKLQLDSLDETGRVVGRLSAIGTAGAIVGTFITGFVLVAAAPTRPVIRALALVLVLSGIAATIWLKGAKPLSRATVATAVLAAGASFAASHPCEYESAYFCAFIEADADREGGQVLWLDTLRHSYVDLDDPTHLEFTYTQWFGDVLTAVAPVGEPLTTLHIGGGGFTMPRYLRATRPGSTSTVLEVDPLLVELAQDQLGLDLRDDIEVLTSDARITIRSVPDGSIDVAIGDAFGGVSVPWHLATAEFLAAVDTTLAPGGVYVANLIDYGSRDFLRAELATYAEVFEHVGVVGRDGSFGPQRPGIGGNYLLLGSQQPLPLDEIEASNRRRGRDDQVLDTAQAATFAGGATVLTDDFAPVDQLLTPLPIG